jgi:hypothetical protein
MHWCLGWHHCTLAYDPNQEGSKGLSPSAQERTLTEKASTLPEQKGAILLGLGALRAEVYLSSVCSVAHSA